MKMGNEDRNGVRNGGNGVIIFRTLPEGFLSFFVFKGATHPPLYEVKVTEL